jgi:hypothetical protein
MNKKVKAQMKEVIVNHFFETYGFSPYKKDIMFHGLNALYLDHSTEKLYFCLPNHKVYSLVYDLDKDGYLRVYQIELCTSYEVTYTKSFADVKSAVEEMEKISFSFSQVVASQEATPESLEQLEKALDSSYIDDSGERIGNFATCTEDKIDYVTLSGMNAYTFILQADGSIDAYWGCTPVEFSEEKYALKLGWRMIAN